MGRVKFDKSIHAGSASSDSGLEICCKQTMTIFGEDFSIREFVSSFKLMSFDAPLSKDEIFISVKNASFAITAAESFDNVTNAFKISSDSITTSKPSLLPVKPRK